MNNPLPTTGHLFLVATPIGNLGDISQRALETLSAVDLIAAEDTRHTQKLLTHFNISAKLMAYHDHNDQQAVPQLIKRLEAGENVALVSDAGTPLISDPGYPLVAEAHAKGIRVIPIPGPCAAISALSASGLPTQPIQFIGFLPPKGSKRNGMIADIAKSTHSTVLYESVHRIALLIEQLANHLEPTRQICIARELTKHYESIRTDSIEAIARDFANGTVTLKGEFVVIIEPNSDTETDQLIISKHTLLTNLLNVLSLSQAVSLYCELTGDKRNQIYPLALELQKK